MDEAIQLTNNDASSFKSYAVSKGYWSDPYINYFSPLSQNISGTISGMIHDVEHKPPEMSRGYFARVDAIRSFVYKFLDEYNTNTFDSNASTDSLNGEYLKCQIVNLGAGYDTLYFNLIDRHTLPYKYIEIDFHRVVSSKTRIIKSKRALFDKLGLKKETDYSTLSQQHHNHQPQPPQAPQQQQQQQEGTNKIPTSLDTKSGLFKLPSAPLSASLGQTNEFHMTNYHLISADLRNLNELDKKLNECNLDRNLPTLFIAECVLVYMNSEHSSTLLKHLAESFKQCCFLNYEQCNLNDKFGEIMLSNMELRACKLLGVDACSSIESQINRFANAGFDKNLCQIITMTDYYLNKMDRRERERIEHIEFLDEAELLMQLLDHYCLCIVANNQSLKFLLYFD